MNNKMRNEIQEVKSLRWLANQFTFIENAKDDIDKMSNAIHVYCEAGANKIEELNKMIKELQLENEKLKNKMFNEDDLK